MAARRPGLWLAIGAAGLGIAYFMTTQNQPKATDKKSFLAGFAPIDELISKREGFPLGVLSAWAAMESNYAMSALAKTANNLFGIKAGPKWKSEGKPYVDMPTHEYQGTAKAISTVASFRRYSSWQESAEDVLKELQTDFKTGGALAALKNQDIGGFLRGIAASGYSTASNYGQRIENFMREIASLI